MVFTKPEEYGQGAKGSGGSRSFYEAPGAWCGWNPPDVATTRESEVVAAEPGGAGEAATRKGGAQDSAANVPGSCKYTAAEAWHEFAYTIAGTVLSMLDQEKGNETRKREGIPNTNGYLGVLS